MAGAAYVFSEDQDAPPGDFGVRGLLAGSARAPPFPFDGDYFMARKPNYPFERMERERQKAAKVAEKARAKAEARERGRTETGGEQAVDSSDDDQA